MSDCNGVLTIAESDKVDTSLDSVPSGRSISVPPGDMGARMSKLR